MAASVKYFLLWHKYFKDVMDLNVMRVDRAQREDLITFIDRFPTTTNKRKLLPVSAACVFVLKKNAGATGI